MNWRTSKSTKELLLKNLPFLKIIALGSFAYIVLVLDYVATQLGMNHYHFGMNDINPKGFSLLF
ncbi:MAG: hypothetical protein IPG24_06110 [Leptospiraceae bacterium]|nr:hypothetical protein [Leptospiraceae bacterium]